MLIVIPCNAVDLPLETLMFKDSHHSNMILHNVFPKPSFILITLQVLEAQPYIMLRAEEMHSVVKYVLHLHNNMH